MKRDDVQTLRDEAYRLAEVCQQRAAQPGATATHKLIAETAAYAIVLAERKANLVPTAAANAKIEALKRFGDQRRQALEIKRANSSHDVSGSANLAAEVLRDMQNEQMAMQEWLRQHEREV